MKGRSGLEADRLEERRLVAWETCLHAEVELGRLDTALADTERLLAEHPLRPQLVLTLMLARHRGGRQADALAAYRTYRDRLDAELGLDGHGSAGARSRNPPRRGPSCGRLCAGWRSPGSGDEQEPPDQPTRPAHTVRRARTGPSRGYDPPAAGRRSTPDPDRPRGRRQDEARASGCGRRARPLRGWRVLRPSGTDPRSESGSSR